jgi:hypothetical protein
MARAPRTRIGDGAQPIEIQIGPAVDGNQAPLAARAALGVGLQSRERQRSRGFGDRAQIIEDVLDRRAHGVGIHGDDFVEQVAAEAERLRSRLANGDAVGEQSDLVQRDHATTRERRRHRSGICRFHPDHLDRGVQEFHEGGDAGGQSAPADGHEDRLDRIGMLPQDFEPDGALAGNDIGVVERMHEGQAAFGLDLPSLALRVVERIAVQDDLSAQSADRFDLDGGRRPRHDDRRRDGQLARRERHALSMIARRCADDAKTSLGVRQLDDLVVGTAKFERKDRLQVLPFQEHGPRQALREPRHGIERGFDRDVVDTRGQDALSIVSERVFGRGHRACSVDGRRSKPAAPPPSSAATLASRVSCATPLQAG